jgi:hypothetical protein
MVKKIAIKDEFIPLLYILITGYKIIPFFIQIAYISKLSKKYYVGIKR